MDQGYGQQDDYYGQQGGQQFPPGAARPYVDPNASGEVDPSQYPAPKESTHKIRGRFDLIEKFFPGASHELLFAKSFYFFFFSAFGSLFPLMAIYFKQMAMSGGQTGILIGCRPFIEFLACPFWGSLADKFRKGKLMLLASVLSWIIFTIAILFVQPPASACIVNNGTHEILVPAFSRQSREMTSLISSDVEVYKSRNLRSEFVVEDSSEIHRRVKRLSFLPPNHIVGKSPVIVTHVANYEKFGDAAQDWISPPFASIVYHQQDVQKVFFLMILVVMLGEFFSSPAITLADHAVLSILGEEAEQYGKQRMFGSVGWGLTMLFVGIGLDRATQFPDHPCEPHDQERNYSICFAVFSVLMGLAMLSATQFKFDYDTPTEDEMNMKEVKEEDQYGAPRPWNEPKIPMQQVKTGREKLEEVVGTIKTRVFAQTVRERPQWMLVLREFKTVHCIAFLIVAWWMGFGIGLIFAFLFWHLQDFGGTPTLFGIASILNHISEIIAYFFSFRLIAQIGHVKVLCIGLLCNVLRFLYVSWMTNPWAVLPFEFIQGITHAAVWAACCSYIAHNTPQHLRHEAQGVLQGLHHGIGRGCGAIIGGFFVSAYGTTRVFFGYGVLSFIVLAGFVFVNFYRREGGFQPELPPEVDPHQMADEGAALAPHGVPANPIPRASSTQHLDRADPSSSYGSCTTNGMLDVQGNQQGGTNPFSGGDIGGGGGYNYTHQSNYPYPGEYSAPTDNYNKSVGMNPFRGPSKDDAASGDLSGEPEWPFGRYKNNLFVQSPTDSSDPQAIKRQFQIYNELVLDEKGTKLLSSLSPTDAGDLGCPGYFIY